jgi:hypothetical protein
VSINVWTTVHRATSYDVHDADSSPRGVEQCVSARHPADDKVAKVDALGHHALPSLLPATECKTNTIPGAPCFATRRSSKPKTGKALHPLGHYPRLESSAAASMRRKNAWPSAAVPGRSKWGEAQTLCTKPSPSTFACAACLNASAQFGESQGTGGYLYISMRKGREELCNATIQLLRTSFPIASRASAFTGSLRTIAHGHKQTGMDDHQWCR